MQIQFGSYRGKLTCLNVTKQTRY